MTKGTHPTQIRLTDDDRLKVAVIRERHGLTSLTQAIRRAIATEYYAIPEADREQIARRLEKATNQERR